MSRILTEVDVRQSMSAHAAATGAALHMRYGPRIGARELVTIMTDRSFVRYPCEIVFDQSELLPTELAYPAPHSDVPEDGFTLYVHPYFKQHPEWMPHVVIYQLVVVNYGAFASSYDAEVFGAAALGLEVEDYYNTLVDLSNELV